MYAFQTSTTSYPETDTLAFGQLSGGAPQTIASVSETSTSNAHVDLIGWTTM
jgi:hypothetical protein